MEITPIIIKETNCPKVESEGSASNMFLANLFFGFPGLVLLIVGFFISIPKFDYFIHGVKAEGKVTAVSFFKGDERIPIDDYSEESMNSISSYLEYKKDYYSVYEYNYNNKEYTHIFWDVSPATANKTQLYFKPENPSLSYEQSELLGMPFFFFAMGGTFFGIGFIFTRGHFYQKKQNQKFWKDHPWVCIDAPNVQQEKGIIAKIIEEKDQDAESKFSKSWCVLCECTNSVTGEKLLLKSANFWTEPYKYLKIGDELGIILDKTNKNKYIIDVNSAFERNAERYGFRVVFDKNKQ